MDPAAKARAEVFRQVLAAGQSVRKVGGNRKAQKRVIFLGTDEGAPSPPPASAWFLSYRPGKGMFKIHKKPPRLRVADIASATVGADDSDDADASSKGALTDEEVGRGQVFGARVI